jgi:hypothetical protein
VSGLQSHCDVISPSSRHAETQRRGVPFHDNVVFVEGVKSHVPSPAVKERSDGD